jgi:tRNA U38,U39,U40 pseudouridine synthase TruA
MQRSLYKGLAKMKIALGVEYMGSDFHGWQLQKSGITNWAKIGFC